MRKREANIKILAMLVGVALFFAGVFIPICAQSADLEHARRQIEKYSKLPKFIPPGKVFDARKLMAGKSMMSIPIASQIPFVDEIESSMEEAAKQVGFRYIRWRNQGQSSQWVQGMNFAINQKVDLIDLMGAPDPRALRPQIEAARNAGIQVWGSHVYGYTQELHDYMTGGIPVLFEQVGRLLADWVILKTKGKANVLVVESEIICTPAYVAAMEDEFETRCPECKRRYVNVAIPDWSTKIQPIVQSEILRNPDLNYVIPIFDGMTQFVAPAITITNARDRVKIATFNGTPFVLKMIQDGQVEVDIGEDTRWIGKSYIDTYMRAMGGLDLPKFTSDRPATTIYFFDKNNVHTAGTPPKPATGYGTEYLDGYRKLWGLE